MSTARKSSRRAVRPGSVVSTTPRMASRIESVLRERFGLEAFRPWQREAIEALVGEPGRVLVVAPTGGGHPRDEERRAAELRKGARRCPPHRHVRDERPRGEDDADTFRGWKQGDGRPLRRSILFANEASVV